MRVHHCRAAMLSLVSLHIHWIAKHAQLLSSSGATQAVRIRFRIFRYTLSSHSYIIFPSGGEPLALKLFCPDPSYTFSALCPGSFRDGSSPAYTLLSGFGVISAAHSVASVARRKAVKLVTHQNQVMQASRGVSWRASICCCPGTRTPRDLADDHRVLTAPGARPPFKRRHISKTRVPAVRDVSPHTLSLLNLS
jgi:hypothetical protein